ncbi:hypothetical protein O181_024052 [Austropuccinia psidii MF-1]|uniref:Uncharacterized protein n=1 Tax=Austropuccinia psidii MF-1 TaxID=1389203 RepID=A0A9Q3CKR0_9BASI|nr:hypothetical protein [Austropuccinia psidii MF-1]
MKGVGPRALVVAKGARSPWKSRWNPKAHKRGIVQKGQWMQDMACERLFDPKAINTKNGPFVQKSNEMTNWPYNEVRLCFPQTPIEGVIKRGCDNLLLKKRKDNKSVFPGPPVKDSEGEFLS